jgi:hypothetical protein
VRLGHSPAARYLLDRGCALPVTDEIRFHPSITHPISKLTMPAMVSRITDFRTSEPLSLHFTWLTSDSAAAVIEPRKTLLGGHVKQGGVIRLCPDEDVTFGLGLAEGIETALSILAAGWSPIFASVNASNLAKLPVLDGIDSLTVFADNDASGAGLRASEDLAARWHGAGREVRIATPPIVGTDWNDHSWEGEK